MKESDRISKLEKALKNAHQLRPELKPDNTFSLRIMAELRHGDHSVKKDDAMLAAASRLVWRFAAATTIMAIGLCGYALFVGILPEQIATHVLLNDPSWLTISQIFFL